MKFKFLIFLLISTNLFAMESWQEIKFKNVIKQKYDFNGFKVHTLAFPFEVINQLKHPEIVHLETPKSLHFSLLVGKNNDFFHLLDTNNANIIISQKKFKRMYTGNLIIFEPKTNPISINTIKHPLTIRSYKLTIF